METYMKSAPMALILHMYPIPSEYTDKAVYCRISASGEKVFYYNKDKKFLCEVEIKEDKK